MSRYLIVPCAALLMANAIGCERSKLQQELMGDSTWESSAGWEDVEVKERKHKPDDAWEKKNAPVEKSTEEPEPESRIDEPYPRVMSGTIARGDLIPVLDRGLGSFLQNVKTEPAFHQGGFVGFRILSLFPGDLEFASLDLRPGDTVTRVNGRPIERPEQALSVWEALRTASNLVVTYRRGEEERALRFRIVDGS